MKSTRFGLFCLILDILFAIGILVGSLLPLPPRLLSGYSGYLLHFGAYFVLMFLFLCYLGTRRRKWVIAVVAIVGYGILIEFLQKMVGYRTFSGKDVLFNMAGVACAVLAYLAVRAAMHIWRLPRD